ncbi:pyridoxamine 5'-phosphate oxidase family protein [Pseudohalioglobus lutimaris]|uniref:Pyridoxamine 5'-phosphate oxidase n=1 Tax=Pseudohalioglobus lutimaris TaxID=1737061 RepID=A0A2N5X4V1_9GAMM|nr:pyridoxamine 5'-phosphate oxidase family protein [Pseudohalioglobus lutimaris]PLW69515.1 pyridoxamine 5'-phosphate oxidase [Pseudohalioglobus lutimaris]
MTITSSGPWPRREIDQFLSSSRIPIRLGCIGGDGFPRVVSVWFRYAEGAFYCASHKDSSLVRMLRDCDRVGFEVATNDPPYHGVRGQGVAEVSEEGGAETLRQLIDNYLGQTNEPLAQWLLSRSDEEVLIRIEVVRFFSWDYRQRMQSIA